MNENQKQISVGGREFVISKMDAFKQFHVVRRLGPILGDIIPVAKKIKSVDAGTEDEKFGAIAEVIKPIMDGLSKLSDEDANKVLLSLLSCVEVKQVHGNWARLVVSDNLMIQDMDLPTMLQVAGQAFAFNLQSFFTIAPQVSHGNK